MQNLMRHNANVWQQRPISQDMLHYAAEDVSQLLSLVDRLTTDLGQTHVKFVQSLSAARSNMATNGHQGHHKASHPAVPNPFSPASWLGQLFIQARCDQPTFML